MNLHVVLRPEARDDAADARDYLKSQRTGLGQVFLDRLNETLARVGRNPELYGIVWQNVRAARLRKFPYIVYYRVHDDRIEVLAVMHGSRDSFAWRRRV